MTDEEMREWALCCLADVGSSRALEEADTTAWANG